MAEHVWSVLCQKASIDTDSNQVSLLNVIENVEISETEETVRSALSAMAVDEKTPGISFPMELLSYWIRSDSDSPETGICRMRVESPSGGAVSWQNMELNLKEKLGFRMRVKVNGLPLMGAGIYRFVIQQKTGTDPEKDWQTVARIPVQLTFKAPSAIVPEQRA